MNGLVMAGPYDPTLSPLPFIKQEDDGQLMSMMFATKHETESAHGVTGSGIFLTPGPNHLHVGIAGHMSHVSHVSPRQETMRLAGIVVGDVASQSLLPSHHHAPHPEELLEELPELARFQTAEDLLLQQLLRQQEQQLFLQQQQLQQDQLDHQQERWLEQFLLLQQHQQSQHHQEQQQQQQHQQLEQQEQLRQQEQLWQQQQQLHKQQYVVPQPPMPSLSPSSSQPSLSNGGDVDHSQPGCQAARSASFPEFFNVSPTSSKATGSSTPLAQQLQIQQRLQQQQRQQLLQLQQQAHVSLNAGPSVSLQQQQPASAAVAATAAASAAATAASATAATSAAATGSNRPPAASGFRFVPPPTFVPEKIGLEGARRLRMEEGVFRRFFDSGDGAAQVMDITESTAGLSCPSVLHGILPPSDTPSSSSSSVNHRSGEYPPNMVGTGAGGPTLHHGGSGCNSSGSSSHGSGGVGLLWQQVGSAAGHGALASIVEEGEWGGGGLAAGADLKREAAAGFDLKTEAGFEPKAAAQGPAAQGVAPEDEKMGLVASAAAEEGEEWHAVLGMRELVLEYGRALVTGDEAEASLLLQRLQQRGISATGDPMQRTAFYFVEALGVRMRGSGSSPQYQPMFVSPEDLNRCMGLLNSYLPFKDFHTTVPRSLFHRGFVAADSHVTLLDLAPCYDPSYYTGMIQALADARRGMGCPPPSVTFCKYEDPEASSPGSNIPSQSLWYAQSLTTAASACGVTLTYSTVSCPLAAMTRDALGLSKPSDALVVCGIMRFLTLPDENVLPSNPRSKALRAICRQLHPRLLILAERDADDSSQFFLLRLSEAFTQYALSFHLLDDDCGSVGGGGGEGGSGGQKLPRDSPSRLVIERELFGRNIINIVACEGVQRAMRSERLEKWATRMEDAGYVGVNLEEGVREDVEGSLSRFGTQHKVRRQMLNGFILSFRGTPIASVSAWRPAR